MDQIAAEIIHDLIGSRYSALRLPAREQMAFWAGFVAKIGSPPRKIYVWERNFSIPQPITNVQ